MPIEFYQQPDPAQASGPANSDYAKQLATMLMKGQGAGQGTPGGAPGQMVNGQYVPPSTASYVSQLAGSALKGYQGQQAAGAARAQDILNGGTGEGFGTPGQNFMNRLGGMFGGG